MKPLREPFASIIAGRPAEIDLRGYKLLSARLFTKDLAFRQDEREALGLRGMLPDRVQNIEEQVQLEWEHVSRKEDALEKYIGLAALQDRNATLFYRLLADHLDDLMPVVYTPTVGQACQQFSHIIRRTRGIWITPDDIDRIPELLRNSPYADVRLIVVTDNERILGLGDQGAGGMGIPIGKLALYSAGGGLHPSLTLPISLDVGTDNRTLLRDPLYMGYRARRLRGGAYQELVEAFVVAVEQVWPGCIIQWEDFKGPNALRILRHFRDRVPSFNDDVQGTAAVNVAGVYAAARKLGRDVTDLRFVLAGAGAAGIGIARLLRRALGHAGLSDEEIDPRIALLDSRGLVHSGRTDLDEFKREVAISTDRVSQLGLTLEGDDHTRLCEVIRAVKPDILIGTTGQPGSFDQDVVHTMAEGVEQPIIFALSNPSSRVEATPEDILSWSDGRALIATGSPFAPVSWKGQPRPVGQANNVFIFPGVGMGAVVAEASRITEEMFLVAAGALAEQVTDERLEVGALYPPVESLSDISREVALAVATEAVASGVAGVAPGTDLAATVDEAMWWPSYVPYIRSRAAVHRDEIYAAHRASIT
ncbi:MAG: NAD-dependent malic enzyme [Chloroflexota bacterium]|nr:NAD-dependent malic enzyme [Chloroflexota bacterium]